MSSNGHYFRLDPQSSRSVTTRLSIREFCKLTITQLGCFQTLWLIICVTAVICVGTVNFIKAHKNEVTPWKPEKQVKVVNYDAPNLHYQMPNISIRISSCAYTANWTDYNFSDFKSDMYAQQITDQVNVDVPIDVYLAQQVIDVFDETFFFIFDFVISTDETNPYNTILIFCPRLPVKIVKLTWSDLYLVIGPFDFGNVGNDSHYDAAVDVLPITGQSCKFVITYTEKVLLKRDGSKESEFPDSVKTAYCIEGEDGADYISIEIGLYSNNLVAYWEEYVEYGYLEWFMGIAGLASFTVTVFFVGARRMWFPLKVKRFTGILPQISESHKIYKLVQVLWDSREQYSRSPYEMEIYRTTSVQLMPDINLS